MVIIQPQSKIWKIKIMTIIYYAYLYPQILKVLIVCLGLSIKVSTKVKYGLTNLPLPSSRKTKTKTQ